MSEGEGTLWERFLRFISLGNIDNKSTVFDLGIDLFNAVRGNDPKAIADSLQAIAHAYLPEGAGRDAILAGIDFLSELPADQIELALDFADLLLTILGFIPGAGEPADAAATGLSIARGNYLDATLSAAGMIPLAGLLASVPKLLLLINKIRSAIGKLDPGIARIVADLVTSISNILSKWPTKQDGNTTGTIQSVLLQLKDLFQDAAGRLKRSTAKTNPPSDAPPATKTETPTTGGTEQPSLDPEKSPPKKTSADPNPNPSDNPDGTDLVRRNESSLDDATQASIKKGETPAGFEPVDKSWKNLLEGKAQKTGTPGHQVRVYREAILMAKTGEYERIYLNRSYSTATGVTTSPRRLPDVIGVRKDGKVDVIEVPSKTDKDPILRERNKNAMSQLPAHR